MTSSKLSRYTILSPNFERGRSNRIWIFTPHCVVGQCTIPGLAAVFAPKTRKASSTYGISYDGQIGQFVDEDNHPWTTSSWWNDDRAITVEVASDTVAPWYMTSKAYAALVDLGAEICVRYGFNRMVWPGSLSALMHTSWPKDSMVLSAHRWFAATACVPVDSEVLTRDGWVKISDIQIGEEIACADLDGLNISFEPVYSKVEPYRHDTYTNNDFTATKDHRMVYRYQNKPGFYRIGTYNDCLHDGRQVYIPLAGHSHFSGLDLSPEMLFFLIAVQADGHYMYDRRKDGSKGYYGVEFHLRKDRKIERVKCLLDSLGIPYRETIQSDGTHKIRAYNHNGADIVKDICERHLQDKHFTWDWLNLSPEQAQLFLKEIVFWDGCEAGNKYTSRVEINLDIVNAIAALNNVGSRKAGDDVFFRDTSYITLSKDFTRRNCAKNGRPDTLVSCVSVKTGIFLCRQNGKTFIIGNCPGDWLYGREAQLAEDINNKIKEMRDMTKDETLALIRDVVPQLISEYLSAREADRADDPMSSWLVKTGEFDRAKELGITDGSRPRAFAAREESAVMGVRVYDKVLERVQELITPAVQTGDMSVSDSDA